MATYTVTDPQSGKKVTLTSQDNTPPTEQELEQVFSSIGSQTQQENSSTIKQDSQSNNFFPTEEAPTVNSKLAQLNIGQNLMTSFAADDEARIKYLQKELPGRDIQIDPKNGITIDGLPYNPKGFDFGDFARGAGYALPFTGQVALGVGSAITTKNPGLSALAGVSGGILGEASRIAVGDMLGLDNNGKSTWNALADEAKSAAVGEAVGLGIPIAGKAVANMGGKQLVDGIKNIWQNVIQKVGSKRPDILEFAGKIRPEATEIALRDNPDVVLSDKYINQDATQNAVKKTLFGTDSIGTAQSNIVGNSGLPRGTELFVKSIKDVNDNTYDELASYLIGKDTVDSIKEIPLERILNKGNLNEAKPYSIAKNIIDGIDLKTEQLGKELGQKVLNSEIKQMDMSGLGYQIDQALSQSQLMKTIFPVGMKEKSAANIPGVDKLRELRDLFRSTTGDYEGSKLILTGEAKKIVEDSSIPKYIQKLPKQSAIALKNQIDAKVESIFRNTNYPPEVHNIAGIIKKSFHDKYYSSFGVKQEAEAYSNLARIKDDVNFYNGNKLKEFENTIKNYSSQNYAVKSDLEKLASQLPNGRNILNGIKETAISTSLKKIVPSDLVTSMASTLSKPSFLSKTNLAGDESILRDIESRMVSNAVDNKLLNQRLFVKEAERSLAAKEFMKGTPNLFRIGSLSSMLGIGALVGGPTGAMLGTATSLALSNPKTLSKILIKTNPLFNESVKNTIKKADKPIINESKKRLLNALISSKLRK